MNFGHSYSVREDPFSEVFLRRKREAELDEVQRQNQRNAEYWRNKNIMELAEKLKREEFIAKATRIIDEQKTQEQIQQKKIDDDIAKWKEEEAKKKEKLNVQESVAPI